MRGLGLMIGIELTEDCGALVDAGKQNGVLINVTAGNTVRLLPPFILTDKQADALVQAVVSLIQGF